MIRANFGAIILAAAILGVALIYACSTRYTYMPVSSGFPLILDRWTGKVRLTGESLAEPQQPR
jgi:hypothetical protein